MPPGLPQCSLRRGRNDQSPVGSIPLVGSLELCVLKSQILPHARILGQGCNSSGGEVSCEEQEPQDGVTCFARFGRSARLLHIREQLELGWFPPLFQSFR